MTEFLSNEAKVSVKHLLTELNLPEQTQSRCLAILDDHRTKDILTERNTNGIIAATIYIAAILTNKRLTQQSLADVMDISEATIRKYYTMLVKVLEIKRKT